jgi:hypothetical protein
MGFHVSVRFLPAAALVTLAACVTPGGAPAPAGPPPVILPAVVPSTVSPTVSQTGTTTTTTVSADGRSVETRTASITVTVGPTVGLPAPPNRAAEFLGAWRVSNLQNRECQFRLSAPIGTQDFGFARNMGCTGTQLAFVSRWGLRDGEVHLMNGFGSVQVRLRVTAPDRLDGDGVTMWR